MVPFRLAARTISGCLALAGSFVLSGAKETLSFLPVSAGVVPRGKEACCIFRDFLGAGASGGVGASFLAAFGAGLMTGVGGGADCLTFTTGTGTTSAINFFVGACSFFGALAVVAGLSGATVGAGGGLVLAGATAATLVGFASFSIAFLGAAIAFAVFFACATGAPFATGTCSIDLGVWSPGRNRLRLDKLGGVPLPKLAGWL